MNLSLLKAIPRQSVELSLGEVARLFGAFKDRPVEVGRQVRDFESQMAGYLGVREAVAFGSQRCGMYAVLRSLDVEQSDEVIVPAYTFFSVPACVVLSGAKPVPVDVDPKTWNLDPTKVLPALTPRTRAIIVTHLNGCPADMDALTTIAQEKKLTLIEDAAHALGGDFHAKKVGSFGVGCFSFGEGKNLVTMGGGLISTNDKGLALRLRDIQRQNVPVPITRLVLKTLKLFVYAALTRPTLFSLMAFPAIYLHSLKNGQVDVDKDHRLDVIPEGALRTPMTNLQATLGLAQLKELESRNRKRRDNARWLADALRNTRELSLPPEPGDRTHLYTHFAVRVRNRERFVRCMIRQGVDTQRDYCSYYFDLPDFKEFPGRGVQAKVAESLIGEITYLPNHPSLEKADMFRVADAVRKVILQ